MPPAVMATRERRSVACSAKELTSPSTRDWRGVREGEDTDVRDNRFGEVMIQPNFRNSKALRSYQGKVVDFKGSGSF
jgi:hypothetical protein